WQDVAIDPKKERVYLPQEDVLRFGVSERDMYERRTDDAWRALMWFEVTRARDMLLAGALLALRLPGRIGWELRMVVQGGLRILEKIEHVDFDVHRRLPKLDSGDWLRILWRTLRMRSRLHASS